MNRNRYMKSLWASLVLAWVCVVPLMGQTVLELPTDGGALDGGDDKKYILKKNTTITNTITVGNGSKLEIDLNGYVLTKKGGGFVFTVGENKVITITDSNKTRANTGKFGLNGATVTINGGVITGGTGDRGGAAIVRGTLNFNGGTIAGCVATRTNGYFGNDLHVNTDGCGGALFIDASNSYAGSLVMNGGHIAYCKTNVAYDKDYAYGGNTYVVKGLGGAVFVDSEGSNHASFVMNEESSIYGCVAGNGGAVYVHSPLSGPTIIAPGLKPIASQFTMNGGSIYNCQALVPIKRTDGGGAVFVSSSDYGVGKFTMNKGELYGNTTLGDGNAVYSYGVYNMNDGKIYKNKPGDLPQNYNDFDEYEGNVYGGGVFVNTADGKFTMVNGEISDNYAASGGGVMVWTGSTFTMNGVGIISNNRAIGQGGLGNGGAVYVQSATFNFVKGALSYNKARRYGGAVNINQSATLNLEKDCSIIGNEASDGGGLSQEQGECAMTLRSGIKIEDNLAHGKYVYIAPFGYVGMGGGLFIEKGQLTIEDGAIISGNEATGKGGGVSLFVNRIVGDVDVIINGGEIKNNKADLTGGGIDVYAFKHWSEDDSDNGNNKINDVNVLINGGTFISNESPIGGGIHIGVNRQSSLATMSIGIGNVKPQIIQNKAGEYGGGFAMDNFAQDKDYKDVLNYEGNNGSVTIEQALFSSNTAKNGGGFYVKNGVVTIIKSTDEKKCEIKGNTASEKGGGLYVHNDTGTSQVVTFSGGDFVANTAKYGGGVALKGMIKLEMEGNIENNLATNGGGLYLGEGGDISFGGGLIRYNQATKGTSAMSDETAFGETVDKVTGIGGGIFMDSNTKLEFTASDKLGLYGNIAANGADDIFANGSGTEVLLPDVSQMVLTDFNVPTNNLYWVEDYIKNDNSYPNLTGKNSEGTVYRYQYSLKEKKPIYKIENENIASVKDSYLCLALGYKNVFAIIKKSGLVTGESAIFNVINMKDNSLYATLLLTGVDNLGSEVQKKIALAEGKWKVVETGWSWNYTTTEHENQKNGIDILETNSEENNTFTFTNSIKGAVKTTYDEDIEENVMNTSTSNTGGGSTPAE